MKQNLCGFSFCSLCLMSLFNKTLQSENFVTPLIKKGKILKGNDFLHRFCMVLCGSLACVFDRNLDEISLTTVKCVDRRNLFQLGKDLDT